jgi:hypothetical protein
MATSIEFRDELIAPQPWPLIDFADFLQLRDRATYNGLQEDLFVHM